MAYKANVRVDVQIEVQTDRDVDEGERLINATVRELVELVNGSPLPSGVAWVAASGVSAVWHCDTSGGTT